MKRCTSLFSELLSNYIESYKKINGYPISQEGLHSLEFLSWEAIRHSKAEKVPSSLVLTLVEEFKELMSCFRKERTLFGSVKLLCVNPKKANILINNIEISIKQIELS